MTSMCCERNALVLGMMGIATEAGVVGENNASLADEYSIPFIFSIIFKN